MEWWDITLDDNSNEFVLRIMKENNWEKLYTYKVIIEYKKFVYLSIKKNVVPSYEIDQVWHTHMLYSKDYKKMCNQLGFYLHHQPTSKTKPDIFKKCVTYGETKFLYYVTFKKRPPENIWTNWKQRENVYVDANTHWIIPISKPFNLIKQFFNYYFL
jgi:hypothetical protein